jgi:hypothetical protein
MKFQLPKRRTCEPAVAFAWILPAKTDLVD